MTYFYERLRRPRGVLQFCYGIAACVATAASGAAAATLELNIADGQGEAVPCRVHLADASGAALRAPKLPFWHDHFVCRGHVRLELEPGVYRYEIERGPEYRPAHGSIDLAEGQDRTLSLELERVAAMAKRGWWSGDLHVHRAIDEMPLHLAAEDLHVAPVITWWNGQNYWQDRPLPEQTLQKVGADRYYDVMAGEDERAGGALLYFGLERPLPLPGGADADPEHPSPLKFLDLARRRGVACIDIEKPFWWDMPTWIASGQCDTIGLANNHMCRTSMLENEAWGKPRNAKLLPAPRGNGFWTQQIYYQLLNCGLRIPPSAGSASGVLPNPVGYNRVYVYLGETFSYDQWWAGLKEGRSFVTNGPLLVCRADGELPGHVFSLDEPQEIEIEIELTATDRIPAIEIIQDGEIAKTIQLEPQKRGPIHATLPQEQSGWFLIRAISENPETFRFASTAPFYVEIGETKRRVNREAAAFFLDWLDQRTKRIEAAIEDSERLNEVLEHHRKARAFWQRLHHQADGSLPD